MSAASAVHRSGQIPFIDRFRRLGLQRRIMLYVTVGLAAMFGVLVLIGLGAIQQATQLVYQDRLTTTYTSAGILEFDFALVASDVQEASQELDLVHGTSAAPDAAQVLLAHFQQLDRYAFFRVSGIWLVDSSGNLVGQAGDPVSPSGSDGARARLSLVRALGSAPTRVLQAVGPVPGEIALAAIATHLGADGAAGSPVAVIQTVSINSRSNYVPALYGRPVGTQSSTSPAGTDAQTAETEAYHLEVVEPDGLVVLGIGEDERLGQLSPHYPAIKELMARGAAAAELHQPGPGDTFAPHVMSVVPVASSPFYMVLEQPVDVALALPLQLRDRLLLTTGLGFVAALVVAWITTRHVVRPTEQLTAAAERMAHGDLSSPVDVTAQDEVGNLAESLDAMRQRLKAAYEAAERTNRELEERVAERTARLGQLLRQTISAQEEERRRLARELHDETAQTLAALSIALDRARDELAGAPPDALRQIGEARSIAARLLAETRRLIHGLRPAVLDDMGLLPAIRWYAESAFGGQGVQVVIEAEQSVPRLPSHIEVALFRIVQEAITNVAKHADARQVTIRLAFKGGRVTIVVADDGRGFDVERAMAASGPDMESVGLIGMQERVRLLNGSLAIQSRDGGGTVVSVEAPVVDEAA